MSFSFSQALTSICLVLTLAFLTSCSEDEPTAEQAPVPSFLGENYTINGGTIFDYGAVNYVDLGDPTHYNYDFAIYDGSYDQSDDSFDFKGSFFLIAELLSPGTAEFKAGTFSYVLPDEIAEVEGAFYFNAASVFVDGNENNSFFETSDDLEKDLLYFVTGGTIQVVDNRDNRYTLTYNLILSQVDIQSEELIAGTETNLQFSVSTDFEIVEGSLAGRAARSGKIFGKR